MSRVAPFVLPLLLATLSAQTAKPGDASAIEWQTDFAAARQTADEKHAPLLVVFRCER
jgi:hypothetical protein